MASTDLHAAIEQRLRAVDQRYTSGRRRLVEALTRAGRPMTLPDLLRLDHELAQSSAYRNLAVLEEVGVVARIVTSGDHASFELAEDLTEHHHHIVCSSCGEVSDFALSPSLEAELEKVLETAARKAKYAVEQHRLDLIGRCSACR
ncbi:MAG TPA: transcriptional repressor [Acidimicrobiales bacterium]|nr:transcriptional repressor [Acidimicrobiales bacterium]